MNILREVALVNEGGNIIGHKPRGVLEPHDIPQGVFVLLIDRERQLVLSRIFSKNVPQLSATAMALCEANEPPDKAALRALKKPNQQLHHLGDQFFTMPSGHKMYISVFYGTIGTPHPNETCEVLSAQTLESRLAECTPALAFVWASYKHLLPV